VRLVSGEGDSDKQLSSRKKKYRKTPAASWGSREKTPGPWGTVQKTCSGGGTRRGNPRRRKVDWQIKKEGGIPILKEKLKKGGVIG